MTTETSTQTATPSDPDTSSAVEYGVNIDLPQSDILDGVRSERHTLVSMQMAT
ncbi:hypothetical protein [Haladaptatus halobius]|uniref:hypothetical protein n=1 Tax=Haladaptatus halobius TaxID=2884875 RepID=UPI001D0A4368|nr:hypothetical protein [Haladaptatus halobius]